MPRRPTLRDISERAGVSTYTVSQALTGKSGVSEATRSQVLKIAGELGYVPNGIAASLKNQASRSIGVMTASGRNQYYSMLVQAIDTVLQTAGYHAVTNDAMRGGTYSQEQEAESVNDLLQQRVAAIVATYSLSEVSLRKIERWGIPVVFVDSLPPEYASSAPFVGCDNYLASQQVAQYFASLGLRSAAFLAFPPEWNTRAPRQAGFIETAEHAGIDVQIVESDNTADGATAAMLRFFKEHRDHLPHALYAANTVLLLGALRAIRATGLRVPDDVSVVGFDDFDWAELISPPITVVDQHIDQVGEIAAKAVLSMIADPVGSLPRTHVQVRPDLVIRESCAARN